MMRKRGRKSETLKIHLKTEVIEFMLIKMQMEYPEFAHMVGVTSESIRNFMEGKMCPKRKTVGRMCIALGVEPDDIVENVQRPKRKDREDGLQGYLEKHQELAEMLYRLAMKEGFIKKESLEE